MNHTVKDFQANRLVSSAIDLKLRTKKPHGQMGAIIPLTIKRRRGLLAELRHHWLLTLMLVPAVVYFTIQCYLPMAGIYLAFTRFDFEGGLFGSPFVGFENFKFLIGSGTLFQLTVNTIGYNIAFICMSTAVQIMIAIFLHELPGKRFKKVTQSILFFPYFLSFVMLGTFSYNIFDYETGFLNTALKFFGGSPVDVYGSPEMWPAILVSFYVWKNLGWGVVIYMAALFTIDRGYYEAAEIDGAGMFQRVWHITLPLLAPTFVVLLLFSIGSIMRGQFDLFYQLVGSNGNLFTTTDIIDTYVYRTIRVNFDVGLGTAAGLYQSLFGFVLIMVTNYFLRRSRPEYALF